MGRAACVPLSRLFRCDKGTGQAMLPARTRIALQVLPLALVLLVFFVFPLFIVLAVSFFHYDDMGMKPGFTLENYAAVLDTGLTYSLYWSMIKFAIITWACTLVIGF